MSRSYDEHLDRLSNADYEAECGGQHDCRVAEMEYRGHSQILEHPKIVARQRARRYDPDNQPVCTTTLNWSRSNGYF